MKKFLVVILLVIGTSVLSWAQLNGQFITGQDGHIYFQAFNTLGYPFNISITASSSDRTNSESFTVGQGFILGPTTPWRWYWKAGDVMTVTYPNGQSFYWKCPSTDVFYTRTKSPSFKGKNCTGSVGCSCSEFSPINSGKVYQKEYCKKCSHKKSSHHK